MSALQLLKFQGWSWKRQDMPSEAHIKFTFRLPEYFFFQVRRYRLVLTLSPSEMCLSLSCQSFLLDACWWLRWLDIWETVHAAESMICWYCSHDSLSPCSKSRSRQHVAEVTEDLYRWGSDTRRYQRPLRDTIKYSWDWLNIPSSCMLTRKVEITARQGFSIRQVWQFRCKVYLFIIMDLLASKSSHQC